MIFAKDDPGFGQQAGIIRKKVIDRIYKEHTDVYRHISQSYKNVRNFTDNLCLKVLKYSKNIYCRLICRTRPSEGKGR